MKALIPIIFLLCFTQFTLAQVCTSGSSENIALIAGDSWAQYMWDDGRYNPTFDKFGFADKKMLAKSRSSNPGAGYTGDEYAISGSLAIEWGDRTNYPWIDNVINELNANPSIKTVVLSIGGNDVLAGKSEGGWYQDMDLDVPGSELALLNRIKSDILTVVDAVHALHPDVEFLLSSYDYTNFSVSPLSCWIYACPKREDLSYDPNNPISDAGLNQMMITIETFRVNELAPVPMVFFDNAIGLMHYYYGDGINPPGTLPYPIQTLPYGANFYGGNPDQPALRSNFRSGFDPIHLDADGYEYKIINQTRTFFMPRFRGNVDLTVFSNGGVEDGWSTGNGHGNEAIRVGDASPSSSYAGIISFDTGDIPDGSTIDKVSLFMLRDGVMNVNPFSDQATFGAPMLDVKKGTFGLAQVEDGDANEAADAVDAGCFYGSVSANDYALRIDLNADGLAAINTEGITQFRVYFPNGNPDADYVSFKGGNAVMDNDVTTESLAEYMGSAKPFLDIQYTPPVQLHAKVALEGPYNTSTNLMRTDLNTSNVIPTIEPYSAMGLHNGSEEVSPATLAAFPVVDWVLLELRDKTNPATILETRAGLLLENGDVKDVNGTDPVTFSLGDDSYYVAVRHRNHLAVMTLNALPLTAGSVVDFRTASIFGGSNAVNTLNGVQALWAGDANVDTSIDAGDRSETWNLRNTTGYLMSDCNMNGSCEASDRSITWNNRNKSIQLP